MFIKYKLLQTLRYRGVYGWITRKKPHREQAKPFGTEVFVSQLASAKLTYWIQFQGNSLTETTPRKWEHTVDNEAWWYNSDGCVCT